MYPSTGYGGRPVFGRFRIALSVLAGTLVGFAVLMTFVIKGRPQAGLPLLCSGAILGFFLSSLLLLGVSGTVHVLGF